MVQDKNSLSYKLRMVLRVILLTLLAIIQLFPLLWLIDFSLCESRRH